jgi:hypothetical protein
MQAKKLLWVVGSGALSVTSAANSPNSVEWAEGGHESAPAPRETFCVVGNAKKPHYACDPPPSEQP